MKTQAEIVLKAKEYAESIGSKDGTVIYDYAMGYTQCQVDMAKEIEKYKLFKSKILTAYNIHQGNIHDLRASLNESLNKQD